MAGDLLDRRLVVVTGKGGVGKSTVAAALAVVAARRGRRAVVAEVGHRDDVAATLAGEPPAGWAGRPSRDGEDRAGRAGGAFVERRLSGPWGPDLHHVSVSPESALREYLRDQLPVAAIADLLNSSRVFTALTAATPGMRELLAMGKVWELAQDTRRTPGAEAYDLCVMDAPASGHATTILGAPAQFAATARVGPVARQGTIIGRTIADPAQTAVVVVATPEELPVSEALELRTGIRDAVGQRVVLGIVDGVLPDRFSGPDEEALAGVGGATHPAIAVAREHARRAGEQRRQVARLRRGLEAPVLTLPALQVERLGPAEVAQLADRIERALERIAAGAAPDGDDA